MTESRVPLLPVLRVAEIRDVERASAGAPLMERAGRAAAEVARTLAGERGGSVLVLAGPGNNGGDAMVVARWLRQWFYGVDVVFRGDATKLPADAAAAHKAYAAAGGRTIDAIPRDWRGALIIDGLFGIGLARPLSPEYAAAVEWANAAGTPILALDVPSGIDADTGHAMGIAIRAGHTSTFIAAKPGLLTGDGLDLAGVLFVHPLELDVEADRPARGHRLDWASLSTDLPPILLRRERNVHKGTFGTLGIVGGAQGMVGAPLLAARAALLAGAGRIRVGFVADSHPAVDFVAPELMLGRADDVLAGEIDALACGPGLGRTAAAHELVARALALPVPLVLDADALNLIAADAALARRTAARTAPTIVTPHPAEAARLLACTTAEVQADRLAAALTLASRLNAQVVLKGAGSVLATPDGHWDINASGNPGLASAGTGDVLCGFAAAFAAMRIDARTALRLAVCLHGAAADLIVAEGNGPIGLAASEIAPAARRLLNRAITLGASPQQ